MWVQAREADGIYLGVRSPYEGVLIQHETYRDTASVELWEDSYPDGFLIKGSIFGCGGISRNCSTRKEADTAYEGLKITLADLTRKLKDSPGEFLKEWDKLKQSDQDNPY